VALRGYYLGCPGWGMHAGCMPATLYFFMHAPHDTFAPENAYTFHAMLRAHADVGELPPWPGIPRQLDMF
jgi:hypothetical protein